MASGTKGTWQKFFFIPAPQCATTPNSGSNQIPSLGMTQHTSPIPTRGKAPRDKAIYICYGQLRQSVSDCEKVVTDADGEVKKCFSFASWFIVPPTPEREPHHMWACGTTTMDRTESFASSSRIRRQTSLQ